jgi:acyl-CoA synthetase (AMP-forming)/AMP-acid ligase II
MIDIPPNTVPDSIETHAKWRPDHPAFICGEDERTWSEFDRSINRVANGLVELGLAKGDRVSVLMLNQIETAEIIFGILRAGGVAVPLSAMMPGEGIQLMVNDSDSRTLFVDQTLHPLIASHTSGMTDIVDGGLISVGFSSEGWLSFEDLVAGASEEAPDVVLTHADSSNIIYSSGTTGVPKGIVHSHHSRMYSALGLSIGFRIHPASRTLVTVPLFSNGAWMMFLPTVTVGATTVIMPAFDPQLFLDLSEQHRITHTFLVPTQFIGVLAQPDLDQRDLSSYQIMVSSAAPLMKTTKEEILERLCPGLIELYGLTEGFGTILMPEETAGRVASVGKPMSGSDMVLLDDNGKEVPQGEIGEITGRGTAVMTGYHKRPDLTDEILWRDEHGRVFIRTGDMGYLDEEGYLYISERKKDMIISGGLNVYPRDIEEVVAEHPAVAEVGVIGIPHPKWGESPVALVVPRADAGAVPDQIKEWANERLGKHQRIQLVELREELPRNPIGKILKRQLREEFANRADSSEH